MNDARANQRHLPQQHVEELRELVQAGPANKSTQVSNTRIFQQLHVLLIFPQQFGMLFEIGIRIRDHRPELEGEEAFPAVTDDLPEIEEVSPIIEFDTKSENQKDRQEHYETEQGEYNVYQAFYNGVE